MKKMMILILNAAVVFCKMSPSAAVSAVMIVLHVSCINWMDQGNIESIKIIHGCRRGKYAAYCIHSTHRYTSNLNLKIDTETAVLNEFRLQ